MAVDWDDSKVLEAEPGRVNTSHYTAYVGSSTGVNDSQALLV